MTFQASNLKGRSFLNLLDGNSNSLSPSYINRSLWLQHFGHSNSLCARATRTIVNHTPISEYRLRFFPKENFSYSCGIYPIETQQHILHECRKFNNYWNLRRDNISHFMIFLKLNSKVFLFTT